MKEYIERRVRDVAGYIAATGATVRSAAAEFSMSKSSIHKDMTERLKSVDPILYVKVRRVLDNNLEERHIRGGMATKRKYIDMKRLK